MDRYFITASQFKNTERVGRRPMEADITRHRADSDDIELIGRSEGEKQRDCVVDTGVAIDDDGTWAHAGSSSASDNRLALPPMATVLTLNVRSTANRCRYRGPPAFGPVPDRPSPPNG